MDNSNFSLILDVVYVWKIQTQISYQAHKLVVLINLKTERIQILWHTVKLQLQRALVLIQQLVIWAIIAIGFVIQVQRL